MLRLPVVVVLLASACGRPEPDQLPAGSVVAAFVSLNDRVGNDDGITVDVSFYALTTGPPIVWDTCGDAVGVAGAPALDTAIDIGEPWVAVAGERLALSPGTGKSWSGDEPVAEPAGEWLGGGWTGGADLEAFSVEEGIVVPDVLELRSPELDAGEVVDPDEDLVIRWRGSSPGFVGWLLGDGHHFVSCNALDDGRFVVPATSMAELTGEGTLTGVRIVREHYELASGAFVMFSAYRDASGTLTFGSAR